MEGMSATAVLDSHDDNEAPSYDCQTLCRQLVLAMTRDDINVIEQHVVLIDELFESGAMPRFPCIKYCTVTAGLKSLDDWERALR
jgi:hypothetical protein